MPLLAGFSVRYLDFAYFRVAAPRSATGRGLTHRSARQPFHSRPYKVSQTAGSAYNPTFSKDPTSLRPLTLAWLPRLNTGETKVAANLTAP